MLKVMVVDDDALVRKGFKKILDWKALGAELVCTAETGKVAIEYLNENEVDVIISDVVMPECDGLELVKYVYETHPDTLVVLISAHGEFEYAQQAIRYNVKEYLTKPITKANLEYIERVIRKSFISNLIKEQSERFSNEDVAYEIKKAVRYKDEDSLMEKLNIDVDISVYGDTDSIRLLKEYYKNIIDYLIEFGFVGAKYLPKDELLDELEQEINADGLKNRVKSVTHKIFQMASMDKNNVELLCDFVSDIIMSRYNDFDLNVNAIANELNIDAKYIGSIFKECRGITIKRHLDTIRMEKSVELLGNTNLDIKEISKQIGILDYRYFIKKFKDEFKCTPTEYREKIKKGDV